MSAADQADRGRGRPSLYTRQQHLDALAWFRQQDGRRGAKRDLAKRLGCSPTAARNVLYRAELYEQGIA